ncbi:MAG: hypothetical protein HGB20_06260 [Chlorobiaceae bacterium]|nr:hypothetical protein [Chlorobiaceae bacterium]
MGTSRTACSIDMHESAVVRLHESDDRGCTLTGCAILPFGLGALSAGKGKRLLKKLARHLRKLQSEQLAFCISPEIYLPLPTSLAPGSTAEEVRNACILESEYFLSDPSAFHCDVAGADEDGANSIHEKRLMLFYPGEPARTLINHFSAEQSIRLCCSPQLSLLHLSEHAEGPQAVLELENRYILLAVANNGRFEKFSCRQVKSRDEAMYFTIRELSANPRFRETGIQVCGSLADKAMHTLIEKETQIKTKPLGIPPSLRLSNPERFPIASPAAIKAISTALMALTNGVPATFLQ